MGTLFDIYRGLSAYPLTDEVIQASATKRGVNLFETATQESLNRASVKLVKADLYMYLSIAPNVTQGGVSYTLSDEQRKMMRDEAATIYSEEGDVKHCRYGYKGSRL